MTEFVPMTDWAYYYMKTDPGMCWEKVFLSTTIRILMSVNRENIDSINGDELFNIVIVRSV